jgi:hypothetical protein
MQTGEAQRAARRVNLTIVAKHLTIGFLLDDFWTHAFLGGRVLIQAPIV